jgi:hypothetical protein
MSIAQTESRADLVRQAFWLEWLTIAWMVIEAALTLWSGYIAHSISLLAFGLDSVIELVSASVLVWRLTVELRHGQVFSEKAEQRASKIGGALLFALATYVMISAAWSLWTQRVRGESSGVTSWPRQASDEPSTYRIDHNREHDRYTVSDPLQCSHARGARREYDVGRKRDQFLRVTAITIGIVRGPAGLRADVVALRPS